jgi:hypothetical protein
MHKNRFFNGPVQQIISWQKYIELKNSETLGTQGKKEQGGTP